MELTIEQKKAVAMATARKRLAASKDAATSGVVPQGMSGVNEGLANALSLPNTLISGAEMGLRSIGPVIGNALGGHFEMPQEPMLKLPDAGQNYRSMATEIGAIKPETDDPTGKFARRVGEEVGANLIPAMGAPSKVASLAASVGSGLGAATAQLAFPDNPFAEFIGQLLGGGVSLAGANAVERNQIKLKAPSVEELKTQARGLYDAAGARGVRFAQPAVKKVADEITAGALSDGLDPTLHAGATAAVKRLQDAANVGMTVKDAQTIRRVISAAAKDPMNPDQARIVSGMLDKFDDFVGGAAPELSQARKIYHQAKKGEMIERTIELARSKVSTFSQSGFENALRDEFKALDRQIIKGQIKGLSEEEIDAIRKVSRGGPLENTMRALGKFAPTGVVSTGISTGVPFAIGNAVGGPGVGAVAAGATMGAGFAGRHAATALTERNANVAEALMRRGGAAVVPAIAPTTSQTAQALAVGQAANQNAPRSAVEEALRLRANRTSGR